MIVKKRSIPLVNLKLEALLRRILPSHPKVPILKENLLKRNAGYQGERSLDYPLSFLHEKEYLIFHDLRLKVGSHYFQIDTLVICQKFILIIEVKNIMGTLYFDQQFHQLIRTINGEETVFPDPVIQLKRQMFQLKQWLDSKQIVTLPIIPLVVISNPKALIQTSSANGELNKMVINRYYLSTRLQQIEKEYDLDTLSLKEIKKLSRLLLKEHTPLVQQVLEQYEIKPSEILTGVICPSCGHLPMTRVNGSWLCQQCQQTNKTAHISALKDYFLLCSSQMTNKDAREFLNIESPFITSRLLRSMDFPSSGNTKNKVYMIEFEEFREL